MTVRENGSNGCRRQVVPAAIFTRAEWAEIRRLLGLSARELQIVEHILAGRKLLAIAYELGLALGTVKTYSQRIHRKLGVSDQRELTLRVMQAHLAALGRVTAGACDS